MSSGPSIASAGQSSIRKLLQGVQARGLRASGLPVAFSECLLPVLLLGHLAILLMMALVLLSGGLLRRLQLQLPTLGVDALGPANGWELQSVFGSMVGFVC